MNCPNCGLKMSEVKTESHYGIPIVLDQCLKCGGLWFEKEELLRTKQGESEKIESMDKRKLKGGASLEENLICPHDNTPLKQFSDPNFPKEIQVESCPKCGGFWFNRGEFRGFQKHQKERKKQLVDSKFKEQIEGLLRVHSETKKYDTLGKLGKFLSVPMGPNMQPIPSISNSTDISSSQIKPGNVANLVMEILRALFMMFLKR